MKKSKKSVRSFLKYCVFRLENHKIEETEKTEFKVKSSLFHQLKVIKLSFAFQTQRKMFTNHHKQFYWTKQTESSRLKAFHKLFLCIIYTFLPILICFLYKKNTKNSIPNIFQKIRKNALSQYFSIL